MKKQKLNSGVVEKTVIQQHSTEQQYMEGILNFKSVSLYKVFKIPNFSESSTLSFRFK